jgi:hypothetical protein
MQDWKTIDMQVVRLEPNMAEFGKNRVKDKNHGHTFKHKEN